MDVVIPRNSFISIRKGKGFITAYDNLTSVKVRVYEGERSKATDNNLLGEFSLQGIPAAPRGVAKFNVCFDIDANGIMNVSAEHITTGNKKNITITNDKGRLSKDEIERMIRDAEKYRREDEEFSKKVEARRALEDYAYNSRDAIRSAAQVTATDRMKMEMAFQSFTQWLESNKYAETDEFKDKMKELETVFNPFIANKRAKTR